MVTGQNSFNLFKSSQFIIKVAKSEGLLIDQNGFELKKNIIYKYIWVTFDLLNMFDINGLKLKYNVIVKPMLWGNNAIDKSSLGCYGKFLNCNNM